MFWSQPRASKKKNLTHRRPRARVRGVFETLENRRVLAAIAVTTVIDRLDAGVSLATPFGPDGKLSLREAVFLSNINPGPDVITVPKGVYKITIPGTNEDDNATGDFDIFDNLTIKNAAGAKPIIDGNGMDRVFDIPDGHDDINVEFRGLVIRGGNVNNSGGGVDGDSEGVNLKFVDTTVTRNQATGNGGGVGNTSGDVYLLRSHVNGNNSQGEGGGIYMDGTTGFLTLNRSSVNGNAAATNGGGIESNSANAFLATGSQIKLNHAFSGSGGGAELATDSITFDNSVVGNNTATADGGGLQIDFGVAAKLTIRNRSTFNDNFAGDTGGGVNGGGLFEVLNSSFIHNLGNGGGGINQDSAGDMKIIGSKFTRNVSTLEAGGAIWAFGTDTLTITDSKFTYNSSNGSSGGGAIAAEGDKVIVLRSTFDHNTTSTTGGAISGASGGISLTDSRVTYNIANTGDGGGFTATGGSVSLLRTVVAHNIAGTDGGGFTTGSAALVSIIDSTIRRNSANDNGGGFTSDGVTLTMTGTTVNDNNAHGDGGGMYLTTTGVNPGVVIPLLFAPGSLIANSTIGANGTAGEGGGIFFDGVGDLNIFNATIARNAAATGGGVFHGAAGGNVNVGNTIIALNTAPTDPDVSGTFVDSDFNLIFDLGASAGFTGANDIVGLDPLLGPLANNGGPTQTYALLAGSPAIDTASNAQAPLTDQRGITRPQGLISDIGAFEVKVPALAVAKAPANQNQIAFTSDEDWLL